MTKHTEGTWNLYQGEQDFAIEAGGGTVCQGDDTLLAWKENARLIAAAPELLAALRLCLTELRYFEGESNKAGDALIDAAYNAAEAAIAKAIQDGAQ